ncbi:MAG: hypothetical protein GWO22_32505 [Actinobacteria bacterium]|nr:hypothetical protein [Actinomycetota bacterium]
MAAPFAITALTPTLLRLPAPARLTAGALLLAPVGLMMGIMFPRGVAHLEARAPHLVAWAWGINGTVSVIAAVAAALLALSFGFTAVIALGAGCYAVAALMARAPQPPPVRVNGTNDTSPRLSPTTSPDSSKVKRQSV